MSNPPEDFYEILKNQRKKPKSFEEIIQETTQPIRYSTPALAPTTVPTPTPTLAPTPAPAPTFDPKSSSATLSYPGGEVPIQTSPYLTKKAINRPSTDAKTLEAALSIRAPEAVETITKEQAEKMLEPASWQAILHHLEPFDYPRGLSWYAMAYAASALPDADTEIGKTFQQAAGDLTRWGMDTGAFKAINPLIPAVEGKATADAFENLGQYMYAQVANGSIYKNARRFHGDLLPGVDTGYRLPNVTGDVILDHVLPRSMAKKMADAARSDGNVVTAEFFDMMTNEMGRFAAGIIPEFIFDPLWALGPAKGGQVVQKGGKAILMSSDASQVAMSASRIADTQKLEGLPKLKKITSSDNARRLTIDALEGDADAIAMFNRLKDLGEARKVQAETNAARYAAALNDPAKTIGIVKEDVNAIQSAIQKTIANYASGGAKLPAEPNLLRSMGYANTPDGIKAFEAFNEAVNSTKLKRLRKTEEVLTAKLAKMSDVKYATNYLRTILKEEKFKISNAEADVARIENMLKMSDDIKSSMIDVKGMLTLHVPLTQKQINIGRRTFELQPRIDLGDTAATIAERVGLQQVDLAKLNKINLEELNAKVARGERIIVGQGTSGILGIPKGVLSMPVLSRIADTKDYFKAITAPEYLRKLTNKTGAEMTKGDHLLLQMYTVGEFKIAPGKFIPAAWDVFAKVLGTRWLQPAMAVRNQSEGLLYFERRGLTNIRQYLSSKEKHWIRLRQTSPELWDEYQKALGTYMSDLRTIKDQIQEFLMRAATKASQIAAARRALNPDLYGPQYTGGAVLEEMTAIRETGAGSFPPELAGLVEEINKMLAFHSEKTQKSTVELEQTLIALLRYGHGDPKITNEILNELKQIAKAIKDAKLDQEDVVQEFRTSIKTTQDLLKKKERATRAHRTAVNQKKKPPPEEIAQLIQNRKEAISALSAHQTEQLKILQKLSKQKLSETTADLRKAKKAERKELKAELTAATKEKAPETPESVQARRDAEYKDLEEEATKTSLDAFKAERAAQRSELEKTLQAEAAPKVDTAKELAAVPSTFGDVPPNAKHGKAYSADDIVVPAPYGADIGKELAISAFRGTSFEPETRALSVLVDYNNKLLDFRRELVNKAKEGGANLEDVELIFNKYKNAYTKHYKAWLQSKVGTYSSAISGGSKFPKKRMQKKMDISDKRNQEGIASEKKQRNIALKAVDKLNVKAQGGEIVVSKSEIEKLKEQSVQMKKLNKIVRKKNQSKEDKILELMKEGPLKRPNAESLLQPDYMGKLGFPAHMLTANRKKIKYLEAKIKKLEAESPPKAAPKAPKVDTTKALKEFDDETARLLEQKDPVVETQLSEHQNLTAIEVEKAKLAITSHQERIEKLTKEIDKKLKKFDEQKDKLIAEKELDFVPYKEEQAVQAEKIKQQTRVAKRKENKAFDKKIRGTWKQTISDLQKQQTALAKTLKQANRGKYSELVNNKIDEISENIEKLLEIQHEKQMALEAVSPKIIADRIKVNNKGDAYVRDLLEWEKDLWVDAKKLIADKSYTAEELLQASMATLAKSGKYLGDPKSVAARENAFRNLQEALVGQPVGRAKLPKGRRKEDEIKLQEERMEVARLQQEGTPEEYQAAAKALDEKQQARMEGMSKLPTVVGERYTAEISEDIKPLVDMFDNIYAAYEEAYRQHGYNFMRSPHERRMLWGVEGYAPHIRTDTALPVPKEVKMPGGSSTSNFDQQLSFDMSVEQKRILAGTIEEINALPKSGAKDSNWNFSVRPLDLQTNFYNSSKALKSVDFLWALNEGGVIRTFSTLEEAIQSGYVPLYSRGDRQKEFDIMMSGSLGEMQFVDNQGVRLDELYRTFKESEEAGEKTATPLMSWTRDIKQMNETQSVEQTVMAIRMHQFKRTKAALEPIIPMVDGNVFNVETRLQKIIDDKMQAKVAEIDETIKIARQKIEDLKGKKTGTLTKEQDKIVTLQDEIKDLQTTIAKKTSENKGTKDLQNRIVAKEKEIARLEKRKDPTFKDKFLIQITGQQKAIDRLMDMKDPTSEAYKNLRKRQEMPAWEDITAEINKHVAVLNSARKQNPADIALDFEKLPSLSSKSLKMFYTPNESGPLFRQYIPEAVEESMRSMLTPQNKHPSLPVHFLRKMNDFWKTRITIMATAFTARNVIGNMYQNALDLGVYGALNLFTNFSALNIANLADHFAKHGSLRNAHEYYKASRRPGEKVTEFINRKRQGVLFSKIYDPKKLNTLDLGDGIMRDADEALGLLHDKGVISGSSTYHADLDVIEAEFVEMAHDLGMAESKKRIPKVKKTLSHIEDFVITSLGPLSGFAGGSFFAFTAMPKKWGQTFSRRAENQGRMVNFIANMKRGGTIDDAIKHADKFLFNYGDLTPWQRDWMRLAIPFFTWNHKNFILHLDMMEKNPQFFSQFYTTTYEFFPRMFQSIRDEEKQQPTDPTITAEKRYKKLKYQPEYNLFKIRLEADPDNNVILEGFGVPMESFSQQVAAIGGLMTELKNFAGMDSPKAHLSSLQSNPATFHYAAAQSHFLIRAFLEWVILKEYMFYQRKFNDPSGRSMQVQDLAATVDHLKKSNILPYTLMASSLESMFPMHKVVDPRTGKIVHYLSDTKLFSRKYLYDISPYTRHLAVSAKVSDVFHTANLTERAKATGGEKVVSQTPLSFRLINALTGIKIKQDLPDHVTERLYDQKVKNLMKKEANLLGITKGGRIPNTPKGE